MHSGGQTVLFVGDLSYADRYEFNNVGIRWDSWGRFIEQSAAYQPWIWSAGNHEIEYMPNLVNFVTSEFVCFCSFLHSLVIAYFVYQIFFHIRSLHSVLVLHMYDIDFYKYYDVFC